MATGHLPLLPPSNALAPFLSQVTSLSFSLPQLLNSPNVNQLLVSIRIHSPMMPILLINSLSNLTPQSPALLGTTQWTPWVFFVGVLFGCLREPHYCHNVICLVPIFSPPLRHWWFFFLWFRWQWWRWGLLCCHEDGVRGDPCQDQCGWCRWCP